MLGHDLLRELPGHVLALSHEDLDVTDEGAVMAAIGDADLVVNAAAWTDVDGAESAEQSAFEVNAGGPKNLAMACRENGVRLIHISTDYVFSGDATRPYPEDAPLGPVSAYGRTKAEGERQIREILPGRHWIVRTSWLYGSAGQNFVSTMRRLESERDFVDVVDDQRGQPTWTRELARQVRRIQEGKAPPGTYHGSAAGDTTWFGLARAVFEEIGADPDRIRAASSEQFPRAAVRPKYSVMGHERWVAVGIPAMRPWREALNEAISTGCL